MSKPKTVSDPTLEKPKTLADYYEVVYLKQVETDGPWHADSRQYPTEEAANACADNLREGRHASIKVVPRNWA